MFIVMSIILHLPNFKAANVIHGNVNNDTIIYLINKFANKFRLCKIYIVKLKHKQLFYKKKMEINYFRSSCIFIWISHLLFFLDE